jgi:hypothetical protein
MLVVCQCVPSLVVMSGKDSRSRSRKYWKDYRGMKNGTMLARRLPLVSSLLFSLLIAWKDWMIRCVNVDTVG